MSIKSNEVNKAKAELITAINAMKTQTVSGIWHGTTASSAKDFVLKYIDKFEKIKDDAMLGKRLPDMFRNGFEEYYKYNISNLEIWRDDLYSEKNMSAAFRNYVLALDKSIGINAEYVKDGGTKEKPSVIDTIRADKEKPRQPKVKTDTAKNRTGNEH